MSKSKTILGIDPLNWIIIMVFVLLISFILIFTLPNTYFIFIIIKWISGGLFFASLFCLFLLHIYFWINDSTEEDYEYQLWLYWQRQRHDENHKRHDD